MKYFVLGLALSVIVVASARGESPSNQPTNVKDTVSHEVKSSSPAQTAAREFIVLLQQEKFEGAAKRFDETMRKALPTSQLQSVWRATLQANGELKKLEASHINHVSNWDVVNTPCVFEKSTAVIRISLDKQQQIAGLFFLPPTNRESSDKDLPEVKLETTNGTLFGTLDLPTGKGPWPVVLIIAGSGPTDRDGNQPTMKNDSLRMVGKVLAAHGVASLRYDKRGVAKSFAAGPVEENLRFENYIDDAAGWIRQLRRDHQFNAVAILGHSEGSLIGILVAKREPLDALISVAGTGRKLAALLRDQLKQNLPPDLFQQSSHAIDELLAGRKVDQVPPELTSLFRPSVQPFLMTWLKYDPAREIADLKTPILLVQGTTDIQVSVDDAKLLAASNKNAHLATIDKMNHVLKYAPLASLLAQANTYADPSLPLAPRFMDEVWSFLKTTLIDKRIPADSR